MTDERSSGPPKNNNYDIHSWWEVPCIAHFCSLFRASFNLIDFDIEDLEEALLTDDSSDGSNTLIPELIARILRGYYGNNNISTFNYQMFLRRLFRQKCREYACFNPFDNDEDFQFLPLRTKVEILHMLCDFRLDADDVLDLLKDLDADSLRVNPLGYDANKSAYWYFYGTRLYKEDYPHGGHKKTKEKKRGRKRKKDRNKEEEGSEEEVEMGTGVWQVVCFTESDWERLALKTEQSTNRDELALHRVLCDDFLPEIPNLFAEKERLQRKRFLEFHPRKSSRLEKQKQRKEEEKKTQELIASDELNDEEEKQLEKLKKERHERWMNRNNLKQVDNDGELLLEEDAVSEGKIKSANNEDTLVSSRKRQTNNSLASATGDIVIDNAGKDALDNWYSHTMMEDLVVGMYKVLNKLLSHEDAWPFIEPVDEEDAPDYYKVVEKPMSLQGMEEKLDQGKYHSIAEFKKDFYLILNNCKQYNGSRNEYTEMSANLEKAFNIAVNKYLDHSFSSETDEDDDSDEFAEVIGAHKNKRKRKNKKFTRYYEDSSSTNDEEEELKLSKREREQRENNSDKNFNNRFGENPSSLEDLNMVTAQTLKDINEWLEDSSSNKDYEFDGTAFPVSSSVPPACTDFNVKSVEQGGEPDRKENIKILENYEKSILPPAIAPTSANTPGPPLIKTTRKYRKSNKTKDLLEKKKIVKENCKQLLQKKKRRDIKRTMCRLQPGKSKGNLYSSNKNNAHMEKLPEIKINGNFSCPYPKINPNRPRPMLSLGSVLSNVNFGTEPEKRVLAASTTDSGNASAGVVSGDDADAAKTSSVNNDSKKEGTKIEKATTDEVKEDTTTSSGSSSSIVGSGPPVLRLVKSPTKNENNRDVNANGGSWLQQKLPAVDDAATPKTDKPTPNLSAWFKAFGAPRVGQKRKFDSIENPPAVGPGISITGQQNSSTVAIVTGVVSSTALAAATTLVAGGIDGNSCSADGKPEIDRHQNNSKSVLDYEKYDEGVPPPTPGRFFLYEEDKERKMLPCILSPDHRTGCLPSSRIRRNSTGSSVSENSSFSQDPNDPMSSPHPSLDEAPYVSPRPLQISPPPPIHSGTLKVGFYQDTFPKGAGSDRSNNSSPRNPPLASSPPQYISSPIYHPSVNPMSSTINFYKENDSSSAVVHAKPSNEFSNLSNYTQSFSSAFSVSSSSTLPPSSVTLVSSSSTASSSSSSRVKSPFSMYPVKKRICNDLENNEELKEKLLLEEKSALLNQNSSPLAAVTTQSAGGHTPAQHNIALPHRHVLASTPYYRSSNHHLYVTKPPLTSALGVPLSSAYTSSTSVNNDSAHCDYLNKPPSTPGLPSYDNQNQPLDFTSTSSKLVNYNDQQKYSDNTEEASSDGAINYSNKTGGIARSPPSLSTSTSSVENLSSSAADHAYKRKKKMYAYSTKREDSPSPMPAPRLSPIATVSSSPPLSYASNRNNATTAISDEIKTQNYYKRAKAEMYADPPTYLSNNKSNYQPAFPNFAYNYPAIASDLLLSSNKKYHLDKDDRPSSSSPSNSGEVPGAISSPFHSIEPYSTSNNSADNMSSSIINFSRHQLSASKVTNGSSNKILLNNIANSSTILSAGAVSGNISNSTSGGASNNASGNNGTRKSKKKKQQVLSSDVGSIENSNAAINASPSSASIYQHYLNQQLSSNLDKGTSNPLSKNSAFDFRGGPALDYQNYLENLRKSTNYFDTPDKQQQQQQQQQQIEANVVSTAAPVPPHFPYLDPSAGAVRPSTAFQSLVAEAFINQARTAPCPSLYSSSSSYLPRATPDSLLRPMMLQQGLIPAHTAGFPHSFYNMHNSRSPW